MTKRAHHSQRSFSSRLLAVAMTLAMAGLAIVPGGVASVQAQSCSPQIGIDGPAPGDVVSGSTTFSGWAVDLTSPGGSGVDQVRLYRDAPPEEGGTPLAVATVGIERPDIDAANGLTNSNSGWTATADFTEVPSGDYTVYIYAHTICGWTYATQAIGVSSSAPAAGEPAPSGAAPSGAASIRINLDSPSAGAMVNNGQAVTVQGWAVDPSGSGSGISSVRMFLDGQEGSGTPLGFANYGKSRPDVVTATGNTNWEL